MRFMVIFALNFTRAEIRCGRNLVTLVNEIGLRPHLPGST